MCTSVLSFYSVKSYEFQHRSVSRSFWMKDHELLLFNMCVFNFKFYIFLVHGVAPHGLRMLSYRCILSIEDIPLTALSHPTWLVSPVSVLFLLSYHMIFLCVLSESLGPTYEREHLYFEHWCNSLNADFSLHPFSCKSHDFIFLYGRKHPMACLCRILPSSGWAPRLVP